MVPATLAPFVNTDDWAAMIDEEGLPGTEVVNELKRLAAEIQ